MEMAAPLPWLREALTPAPEAPNSLADPTGTPTNVLLWFPHKCSS